VFIVGIVAEASKLVGRFLRCKTSDETACLKLGRWNYGFMHLIGDERLT
jgi:hypothetical protein